MLFGCRLSWNSLVRTDLELSKLYASCLHSSNATKCTSTVLSAVTVLLIEHVKPLSSVASSDHVDQCL